jgi:N-acetylneuraminic acid mutarotase
VINFFEEKKNMFISVQNDKRQMTMRNPFRDFNTCISRTKAGDLIVGYPEDRKIHIFSPDGKEIGLIELDYSAIPITQTEKDDHYNELIAFNSERKMEINADELKVIKSNEYFPEHWPYYYDIKVDTDDNILVFKYTKGKDQTFRVYRVYSKEVNFICETTIDSAGYQGPNIGRMKFFKGDLYGLLSQKNGTKEEALVKIGLTGRGGADVSQSRQSTATSGKWTWVAGDSKDDQPSIYGTRGIAASTNKPGARDDSVTWTDSKGNFWLYGGRGYNGKGERGSLNDLWKFDGRNWTWVSGDNDVNKPAVYGTKMVAASTNSPGSRAGSVGWTDSKGNLWLFGGVKNFRKAVPLNDLWKFDGKNWTWVSGDSEARHRGIYGTRGIAAGTNKPGARSGSVSWTDSEDNLWLFGGIGYTDSGFLGILNDLWKFDGKNWTWVSGDSKYDQPGIYGTRGIAAAANKPGARHNSVSWTDNKGNLWLFGGRGSSWYSSGRGFSWESPRWNSRDKVYIDGGKNFLLNDLWKFDGKNWTWVSGDKAHFSGIPVYATRGTRGVPADTNKPGARFVSVSWTDSKGNLWLFGGYGYADSGLGGNLNDLWKFDGKNWTWVSGDNTTDHYGIYGTKGVANDTNKPGTRIGSMSWVDSKGNLWLFGGSGHAGKGFGGRLNDLWKFEP